MSEINKLPEAEKIFEIPISYEERGKEIGKVIGKKEVAMEMLKKGLNIEFISEVTHLDIDKIEKMKEEV